MIDEAEGKWYIRLYFYTNKGAGVVNDFKNVGLMVLGAYIALKLDNPWLLVIMTLTSLLALTVLGWYATHHMFKVMEYLGIRYGSHFAKKTYDRQQEICDTLNRIELLIKKE